MQWYLKVMQNYVGFEGRARRQEYWMFYLVNSIISIILVALMGASDSLVILVFIYFLAIILPSLAVTVRRLHDTGRSGWWMLIGFVPFGNIVLLVFTCTDSQPGDNQYGPNPKALS
ncbi:DUF805 domain-containing protein [Neobacillus novalis]|uniref:DUF805 domain-containing protein n=1 Tax=Neobacillus novalis TaxID=220687 RepID=A0AA95MQA8_9BACI|nr:DUF805 domain-containing protein [Neobacillus novalis]WHY86108.1 DUF805 domain-containing protein [Neobacillus novalis]